MNTQTTTTHSGVIDNFTAKKGFGFIQDDSSKERYFFHSTSVDNETLLTELQVGSKVCFRLGSNNRGVCAKDVNLVGVADESSTVEETETIENADAINALFGHKARLASIAGGARMRFETMKSEGFEETVGKLAFKTKTMTRKTLNSAGHRLISLSNKID